MSIKIKNLRFEARMNPWDVRVDRSTVLGNMYEMQGAGDRDRVCDEYERWFSKEVSDGTNTALITELERSIKLYKEFGKLNLFCWCAPKRCHAETIKRYIESR